MSGPAFWESLCKAGRTIYFPNMPLRLVAPSPEQATKGLNVVTFITVPQTTKVSEPTISRVSQKELPITTRVGAPPVQQGERNAVCVSARETERRVRPVASLRLI